MLRQNYHRNVQTALLKFTFGLKLLQRYKTICLIFEVPDPKMIMEAFQFLQFQLPHGMMTAQEELRSEKELEECSFLEQSPHSLTTCRNMVSLVVAENCGWSS